MAEIELRNENWDAAEAALNKAIQKGNLKNPGNSHLLLGITLFERKETGKARAAFQKAAQFANVAQQARTWIAHIDNTSKS